MQTHVAHDPWAVVRVACTHLARGIGGPEGVALGVTCLALVEANVGKSRAARGSAEACSCEASFVSPYPDPPCGCEVDALLALEASEDPDQRPYLYELE